MRAKNRSPRPTKSDGLHQQRRFNVPNDLFFSPASDPILHQMELILSSAKLLSGHMADQTIANQRADRTSRTEFSDSGALSWRDPGEKGGRSLALERTYS